MSVIKTQVKPVLIFLRKLRSRTTFFKKQLIEYIFVKTIGRLVFQKSQYMSTAGNIVCMMNRYYSDSKLDSSTEMGLFNSLKNYLFLTFPEKTIHAWYYENKRLPILRFILSLRRWKPSMIVLSSWSEKYASRAQFSAFFLNWISTVMPTLKFCEIVWDSVGNYWTVEYVTKLKRDFIVLDDPALMRVPLWVHKVIEDSGKTIIGTPQPMPRGASVHSFDTVRDIDYSFVGLVGNYRGYRSQILSHVNNIVPNGKILTTRNRTQQVSQDEYFDILKSSKILINFSESVSNSHQIKARVWEGLLSGCLLLEQRNPITSHYFRDEQHLVFFDNKDDLVTKLEFYIKNNSKRLSIAKNGQDRALELINRKDLEKFIVIKSNS